jgi:hypothetical protein
MHLLNLGRIGALTVKALSFLGSLPSDGVGQW